MEADRKELGRRIAAARDKADLTQQELAERIGLRAAQSISRYERGETEVPMKKLRRIAEATRQPFEFFLAGLAVREAAATADDPWQELAQRLEALEVREQQSATMLRELLRLVRAALEPPEDQGGESSQPSTER